MSEVKRVALTPLSAAPTKKDKDKKGKKIKVFIPHIKKQILEYNTSINKSWNHVIIHQEPNTIPDAKTKWCASFKSTNYKYIAKYQDKRI